MSEDEVVSRSVIDRMRRHVEIETKYRNGLSTEWVPVASVFDRVPAWAETLGYGMAIGLPAAAAALVLDPVLGVVVGLAGSAVLAAVLPRFYESRTERQLAIERDETELRHDSQQRQIDKLNRHNEQAQRAAKIASRRRP